MKNLNLFTFLFCFSLFSQNSNFIHVDQFGYLQNSTKTAVISNPEIGFNSSLSYVVGSTLEVRDVNTNTVVFSGNVTSWNNGNIHSQSGDRGWWFDFSSVTTPGDYYIYDTSNNESSAIFSINDMVYDNVLIAASKMFYYNRSHLEKTTPYALTGFTDGVSFVQDEFTRDVYDQNNTSTVKDMRGGWFDAGDYNKYVTFAETAIHDLLWAYRSNPSVFNDNFNIPESGNGIPDILDEVKWETDWLLKMINPDGSVHIKMGSRNYSENTLAPPSTNTDTRYYAPICTSSALASSNMLAHASIVFSEYPSLASYSETLENAAISNWNWVLPYLNSNTLEENCDDGSVVAGDADRTSTQQRKMALTAAVYLFELTGDNQYNQYIIDNINDTEVINNGQWDNYNILNIDALLHYTTLSNADETTVNTILSSAQQSVTNNYNNYYGFNDLDLYRAYSNDWTYHWGSSSSKANMGNLNFILSDYNILPSANSSYKLRAKEALHYFHGVNPLDIVYLSNMSTYGAENSLKEVYHTWFYDGTIWDNSETSTYGPAPGFLAGGCNQNYNANTTLSPPYNQPLQKSYLDFNTGFPDNSWEITEPAIYYQAAYIRLLSRVSNLEENSLNVEDVAETNYDLKLTPNPATNYFSITSNRNLSGKLSLYNMNGQLINEVVNYSEGNPIDISNLDKGIYMIQLKSEGFSKTFKLIK